MTWLIRFLFKWTVPFWKWLEPAFCGHDDKPSSRKLSSFAFMIMIGSYTSKLIMRDTVQIEHVYVLASLLATLLLLNGILTVQNVLTFFNKNKTSKPDDGASV